MTMELLEELSTLAQAGSTGIGIILVIYLYLKDKMANVERENFTKAVNAFTQLAGKMHESQKENRDIIEENSRVIEENNRVIKEFIYIKNDIRRKSPQR